MRSDVGEQGSKTGQDGRGATARSKSITVRMHDGELDAVDAWIAGQPDPKPKRPEAIRILVRAAVSEPSAGRRLSANMTASPPQLRAARGFLGISQAQLAEATGLPVGIIRRAEDNRNAFAVPVAAVGLIVSAFEAVGVEFTYGNAPGVRLRTKPA